MNTFFRNRTWILEEIAKKYNVCTGLIQNINTGKNWYDDIDYPIRSTKLNIFIGLHIKNFTGKVTQQYHNNILIGEFVGDYIAAQLTYGGMYSSHIRNVACGKRKSLFGDTWKYADISLDEYRKIMIKNYNELVLKNLGTE